MTINSHIQNILKNSKKDTEWKKEAEERLKAGTESKKSGLIATQLAIYMAEKGISQTALGKITGVSPQQISKVLKGRENLTLATIEKIENALEIQLIQVNLLEKAEVREVKGNMFLELCRSMPERGELIHLYQNTAETVIHGYIQLSDFNKKIPESENYYQPIQQKAIQRIHARFEKIRKMRSGLDFQWSSEISQEDEDKDSQDLLNIVYG